MGRPSSEGQLSQQVIEQRATAFATAFYGLQGAPTKVRSKLMLKDEYYARLGDRGGPVETAESLRSQVWVVSFTGQFNIKGGPNTSTPAVYVLMDLTGRLMAIGTEPTGEASPIIDLDKPRPVQPERRVEPTPADGTPVKGSQVTPAAIYTPGPLLRGSQTVPLPGDPGPPTPAHTPSSAITPTS